jgi:hypothetical protein
MRTAAPPIPTVNEKRAQHAHHQDGNILATGTSLLRDDRAQQFHVVIAQSVLALIQVLLVDPRAGDQAAGERKPRMSAAISFAWLSSAK